MYKMFLINTLTCFLLHNCSLFATPSLSKNDIQTQVVDIGDDRKMYIECSGDGSPTVIFVSGRTDRATIWNTTAASAKEKSAVFSEVATFTHACAYDRPGTITVTENEQLLPSRSSSVKQPITPKNGVADLHALLQAAKIPGPYVLVGHSYGGLIVRLYASTYPDEVVGLILVDTLTEFLYDALKPADRTLWVRLNSNYAKEIDKYIVQEKTDFIPSFEEMRKAPAIRLMPVIVLTSDQTYNFQELMAQGVLPKDTPIEFGTVVFQAHLQGQKQLAELLHAKHISNTHAGHYVQTEQPQLVIEAIRDVIEQLRHKKMITCTSCHLK